MALPQQTGFQAQAKHSCVTECKNYYNKDNKLLLTTKALLSGNLICGVYVFVLTLHISHCRANEFGVAGALGITSHPKHPTNEPTTTNTAFNNGSNFVVNFVYNFTQKRAMAQCHE